MEHDATQPIIFAVMPYGKRTNPDSGVIIDFDQIFTELLIPAATESGCKIIRSDRDSTGGLIHASMFEQILLADIVIADISFPNPNVYYELGLRHSTKSFSTITLALNGTDLPFDIAPLKHIFYEIDNGEILNKDKVIQVLVERLNLGIKKNIVTDSPIFQTIANYPGIDLGKDVIESFRNRIKNSYTHLEKIRSAVKGNNLEMLEEIALGGDAEPEFLFDLIVAYRDFKQYEKMIEIIERYPFLSMSSTGKESLAFALNRRNEGGDRDRAEVVFRQLIEDEGETSERCALLGRVYKDRYEEAVSLGKENQAQMYLDSAIATYREGFLADPRDPYPGINYAIFLHVNGDFDELGQVTPVIAFALLRRGGLSSKDYFDIATHIFLYILSNNKDMAIRSARQARKEAPARWALESTASSLKYLTDICDYSKNIVSILLED